MVMGIQDIEHDVQSLERSPDNDYHKLLEKALEKGPIKQLVLKFAQEFLIYPAIICTLYGLINERGWEFDNVLAFCYSSGMDVWMQCTQSSVTFG